MEQITGIEPASSAWEADVLTIVLYLHKPSPEKRTVISIENIEYTRCNLCHI